MGNTFTCTPNTSCTISIMAVKQKPRREKKSTQSAAVAAALTNGAMASPAVNKKEIVLEDHLPPLALVLTVILCSGLAWILGLRDLMATGKPFLGEMDHAYLVRPCSFSLRAPVCILPA